MGFLRSPSQATQITKYSGLQIQTTSSAIPVPIVYGRNLIAPNVLWYQNFKALAAKDGRQGRWKRRQQFQRDELDLYRRHHHGRLRRAGGRDRLRLANFDDPDHFGGDWPWVLRRHDAATGLVLSRVHLPDAGARLMAGRAMSRRRISASGLPRPSATTISRLPASWPEAASMAWTRTRRRSSMTS